MAKAEDSRNTPDLRAARYQAAREAQAQGEDPEALNQGQPGVPHFQKSKSVAEQADALVSQAMRNGDFDDLKYAGKPVPNLGSSLDPDWWLKGLIEREKLTGLGPPAIMLRHEDAALPQTLDRLPSEKAVTEHLQDFNKRVIEARRQLQGGPPVVTDVKDLDAELLAWRERRAARAAASAAANSGAGFGGEHKGFFAKLFRRAS